MTYDLWRLPPSRYFETASPSGSILSIETGENQNKILIGYSWWYVRSTICAHLIFGSFIYNQWEISMIQQMEVRKLVPYHIRPYELWGISHWFSGQVLNVVVFPYSIPINWRRGQPLAKRESARRQWHPPVMATSWGITQRVRRVFPFSVKASCGFVWK